MGRGVSGPKLTRESLAARVRGQNRCAVARFLETLDPDAREVLEEALAMPAKVFSSPALHQWLLDEGADRVLVPAATRIQDHRGGRGACKCRDA